MMDPRLTWACVWLVAAVIFGSQNADPAFTMGSITCSVVWLASRR